MRWFLIAAVCLGCKGSKSPPKKDDAAVLPADAALADAPVDATADANSLSLVITADGVGPLTIKANDDDAFRKLLPGFVVKSQHQEAEAYSYDEIAASKDGKRILRAVVEGDKLFKIEVEDPMFATESGIAVGMPVADLAAKMADLKCAYEKYDPEGDAEHVDRALRCESESLHHILFEIDHQGFKGKIGAVAPKAIATRKIVQIVWLAPTE